MLILDDVSPLEQIQLTASLASAVKSLAESTQALQRIKHAADVSRILGLLGEAVLMLKPLKFSMSDKQASANELARYLDGSIAALASPFREFEAQSVAVLAQRIGDYDLIGKTVAMFPRSTGGEADAANLAVFNELKSRGVKVNIDTAEVLRKAEESNKELRASVTDDPEWAELNTSIRKLNNTFIRDRDQLEVRRRQELAALRAGERSDRAILDHIEQQQYDLITKYRADFAEIEKQLNARKRTYNFAKVDRARAMFQNDGAVVISEILKSSPVNQVAAEEWASKQVIDKDAAAKLSRLGYKKEDVLRDLAEFYRLSGGKSSAIRVSAGGRRANAQGVNTHAGEKVINLGTRFDKTVLFHELAHFLENDPIAKAAANGFLLKRRESAKLHTLRLLTGNPGYEVSEVAYKDSFMDPYVGKVYQSGITEVFSMGVQYLANPRDAAIFAAKDPEMFALVTGYLTQELTPAMQAKLHMHEGAVDDIHNQREEKASAYDAAIKDLARNVAIIKDDWWERVKDSSYEVQSLARLHFDRKKPPIYLGSFGDFRLFQGVFRNGNTKRKANGFLVVTDRMGQLDGQPVHGSIDAAKAYIAITEKTGLSLSGVWYHYFYESTLRDAKSAVIEMTQSASQGKPE